MTSTDREPVAWRMVPVEPTEEMLKACDTIIQGYGAKLVWARMQWAAPPPTAPTVEEVARALHPHGLLTAGNLWKAARIIEMFQGKA